jgi:transposase InsO family protein
MLAQRSNGKGRRSIRSAAPSYLSAQLGSWLAEHGIAHSRGKPYHPLTQGKIERYHRSLKNQILLENYYLPGQLEVRLAEFVEYYTLPAAALPLNVAESDVPEVAFASAF